MVLVYNFFVKLYAFAAALLYPFNSKAKKWIFGRINWGINIPEKGTKKRLWLHCASLGEFEQARPIIEKLLKTKDCELVVSFFSPSGYEVRKNYPLAKAVFYLPIDTKKNASVYLKKLQPEAVLFVKYDLWYHFISEAKKQKIPMFLVSAVFRKDQIYFKPWGGLFRKMLNNLDAIFVQDNESVLNLKELNIAASLSGDVRYDRALEVIQENFQDDLISKFSDSNFIVVFGSTYNTEHEWLKNLAQVLKNKDVKFRLIIAPHQIGAEDMVEVKKYFPNASYYSNSKNKLVENFKSNILILDTMGMLTYVYRYANLAYVGGGFEPSLHNALEAAVYGIPVVVGPNHKKFPEVKKLIEKGGFNQVNSKNEFLKYFEEVITHKDLQKDKGDINAAFVKENSGASKLVLEALGDCF